MTAAPAMTNGVMGNAIASTLNMMPGGGQGSDQVPLEVPIYKAVPIAPKQGVDSTHNPRADS